MEDLRYGVGLVATTLCAAAVLWPASAAAQNFEGARLLGFAEAQRALATGNDAMYVNPAGIAMAKVGSIELGYLDDLLGSDRRFNASVVDGTTEPISGGVAYTYTKRAPDDLENSTQRLEGHRTEVSLATKLWDSAALGLTLRYLTFSRKDGEEDLPEEDFKSFNVDVGFQWRVWEGLSLGVVAYNLTNSDAEEVPISWGAGLGYQADWFSIEGDVRYNAQIGRPRYSGAAGVVISDLIPIRAGFTYDYGKGDQPDAWSLSVGAGLVIDQFSFDIGFRQRLTGQDLPDYGDERVLGVAMRILIL